MREGSLMATGRLIGCAAILLIAARCDRPGAFAPELRLGQTTALEFGYMGKREGLGSEYEKKIRLEITPKLNFDEKGVGIGFRIHNVGGDALVFVGKEDLILVDRNGKALQTGESEMELDPGDEGITGQMIGFGWDDVASDHLQGASLVIQMIDARERRQKPVCRMRLEEMLMLAIPLRGVGAQIEQMRLFE